MKHRVYSFLSAGETYTDMSVLRTMMLINALLFIMGTIGLLALYLNFAVFHYYKLAILDMIVFITSLAAIIDFKKHKVIDRTVFISVGSLFLFLLAFSYENEGKDFGLIWNIFLPVFAITLMGRRKGIIITGLFYLILFSMAYANIGIWDDGRWNVRSFVRLNGSLIVLALIAYFYRMILNFTDNELQRTHDEEAKYLQELHKLSITDPLTGLFNRRRMNEVLQEQIDYAKRYESSFSLILFDIDNFKHVNDQFGHNVGDQVLVMVSNIAKNLLRKTDSISRWGGEEFLILVPKTQIEEAVFIADKLRSEIENATFSDHNNVTCSFGIAEYKNTMDIEAIVNQTDKALYEAKNSGKNRLAFSF